MVLQIKQTATERGETGFHDAGVWRKVCTAPCDLELPRLATYRIRGENIWGSEPFKLPLARSYVSITADGGSKIARTLGIALTPVGALMILAGVHGRDTDILRDNETLSEVAGASGAVLLAIGIYLIVANGTDVDVVGSDGAVALTDGLAWTPRGLVF